MDRMAGIHESSFDSVGIYDTYRKAQVTCSVDLLKTSIFRSIRSRSLDTQGFHERKYDGSKRSQTESHSNLKYSVVEVERYDRKKSSLSDENDLSDQLQTYPEEQLNSSELKPEKVLNEFNFSNSFELSEEQTNIDEDDDPWEMVHFKNTKEPHIKEETDWNCMKLARRKSSYSIFEDCSTYDITCLSKDSISKESLTKVNSSKNLARSHFLNNSQDKNSLSEGYSMFKEESNDSSFSKTEIESVKDNSIRPEAKLRVSISCSVTEEFLCSSYNTESLTDDFSSLEAEKNLVSDDNSYSKSDNNLALDESQCSTANTENGSSKVETTIVSGDLASSKVENNSISDRPSGSTAETENVSCNISHSEAETNLVSDDLSCSNRDMNRETYQSLFPKTEINAVSNNTPKFESHFTLDRFQKPRERRALTFLDSRRKDKFTGEQPPLCDTIFSRVTYGECHSPTTPLSKSNIKWPNKQHSYVEQDVQKINNLAEVVSEDDCEDNALPSKRKCSKRHRKRSRRKSRFKKPYIYECSKCGISYIIPTKGMNDVACCLHCDLWTPVEPIFLKREKQSWNTCRIS